ncbi:MAG: DUF4347 domain-containing protein, partial [Methylobacteriaceae bacterium]|nr:DUF4347 domain-containing protein [Methylobacteriaceae bacterium]
MTNLTDQGAASGQVVFIDSRVPDLQDLIDNALPGEKVFVLDPNFDGVQQIADILAANNLTDLSAISIVGHGASGEIDLGSTVLDDGDLAGHAATLAKIGAALAPGGDIGLYACDVASGSSGQQFIADLSTYAGGADVAAATHLVGSADLGGSWTLDASTGAPVAPEAAPFTSAALSAYDGVLSFNKAEVWTPYSIAPSFLARADNTGSGDAVNATEFQASNAGLQQPGNIAFDPNGGVYFVTDTYTSGGGFSEFRILEGTIASVLSSNGSQSLTTVYDSGSD